VCTEDELAAVLAHELGHLEDGGGFHVAGLTMTDRLWVEVEADRRAVWRLIDAGYDPSALPVMVDRLADEQPPGWAEQRLEMLAMILAPEGGFDWIDANSAEFAVNLSGDYSIGR
jgi:hypothetical protein